MKRSTITSKGQTTIPKSVRDHLNLKPGDSIEFLIEEKGVMIRPASIDISELNGILPRPQRTLSLSELDQHFKKRLKGKL